MEYSTTLADATARHLDDIERHMYLRNWMDGADILSLGFVVKQTLKGETVAAAARRVQAKYQILQSKIVETSSSPSKPFLEKDFKFVIQADPPAPRFRVEIRKKGVDDFVINGILEEEYNSRVDSVELPWRIRLTQFPDESRSFLILTVDHSIADPRGAATWLKEILLNYVSIEKEGTQINESLKNIIPPNVVPVPPPPTILLPSYIPNWAGVTFSLIKAWSAIGYYPLGTKHLVGMPVPTLSELKPQLDAIPDHKQLRCWTLGHRQILSIEDTEALVKTCRAAKTTVGSALFLAVACALERLYHNNRINIKKEKNDSNNDQLDSQESSSAMFGLLTVDTRSVLQRKHPELSLDTISTCLGSQYTFGHKFTIPELHEINSDPKAFFWDAAKRVRDAASKAINSGEIFTVGYFASWRGGVKMEYEEGSKTLKDRTPSLFAFGLSNVGILDDTIPKSDVSGHIGLREYNKELPKLFDSAEKALLEEVGILDAIGGVSRGPEAVQWVTAMTLGGRLQIGTTFPAEIFKREDQVKFLGTICDILIEMSTVY